MIVEPPFSLHSKPRALTSLRREMWLALFVALSGVLTGCSRQPPVQAPTSKSASKPTTTTKPRRALPPSPRLSLSQAVGQRMIYGYPSYTPPLRLRRLIARGEASGVILFKRNIKNRSHLAATLRALQLIARPKAVDVPLLIMVDQEGGRVQRLSGAPLRSPGQLGRIASSVRARQAARNEGVATGINLQKLGINVNLAPVVDVARAGSHTERWSRSYGRVASRVSALSAAFARGMWQQGTVPCWKHFPGLGAATVDEDFKVNRLSIARDVLHSIDLLPFRAAPPHSMVMTSTAIYPALDRVPAVFSSRIVGTALRQVVGFKGLAITDDLQVPALKSFGSPTRRGLLSIRAGNDLLLYCQSLEEGEKALRDLTHLAQNKALDNRELLRTAARILAFRARLRPPPTSVKSRNKSSVSR